MAEILDHRPTDPAWRGEPLARGRHSRLELDFRSLRQTHLRRLLGLADSAGGALAPERAEAACAEATRELLGDFSPALLLLPAIERCRVRALLAYAWALHAGGRRHGLAGDRLALINRHEYALERAFAGEAGDEPIFVRMAQENARRRWPVDALDELATWARREAVKPQSAAAPGLLDTEADARRLTRALGTALLEERMNAELNGFAGALVVLQQLQRQDREAARRECARLRPRLLRAPRGLVELPATYRRAGVYALLAALRLLSLLEDDEPGSSGDGDERSERGERRGSRHLSRRPGAPRLGTSTRIGLLLRARWFGARLGLDER
ncbi:MAG TPA: hypothetical protein VHR45_04315 [Thermoanaerobaculia bacterium]|nr:hypothetical protein [Thermoanaerobaculia bacterium]